LESRRLLGHKRLGKRSHRLHSMPGLLLRGIRLSPDDQRRGCRDDQDKQPDHQSSERRAAMTHAYRTQRSHRHSIC